MDQVVAGRERRNAIFEGDRELLFDLRDDRRRCRTAVGSLELDSVPAGRIVAGGDLNSTGRAALLHHQGNRRGGAGLIGKPHRRPGSGDGFGGDAREAFRAKAAVVAHHHAFFGVFHADHVARGRVGHDAHVVFSKILGDYRSPTVGSKFNFSHGSEV